MKSNRLIGPLCLLAMVAPGLSPVPATAPYTPPADCDSGWQWGGASTTCKEECDGTPARNPRDNSTWREYLAVEAEQSYDRGWVTGAFDCGGGSARCMGVEKCGDDGMWNRVDYDDDNGVCKGEAAWSWNWGRVRVWCWTHLEPENRTSTNEATDQIPHLFDFDLNGGIKCPDHIVDLVTLPDDFFLSVLQATGNVQMDASSTVVVDELTLSGIILTEDGCMNFQPGFESSWNGSLMEVAVFA